MLTINASLAKLASDKFVFGDNRFGSAEYRKHICSVLVSRAIEKLGERK